MSQLSKELGVHPLGVDLTGPGTFGCLITAAGGIASLAVINHHQLWPILLLPILGIGLIKIDPGSYGSETVASLARKVATRNFGFFARQGADRRPEAVWTTLCAIVSEVCAVVSEDWNAPISAIGPQTRFFRPRA